VKKGEKKQLQRKRNDRRKGLHTRGKEQHKARKRGRSKIKKRIEREEYGEYRDFDY